ncbi:response regulator, partial [Methanobacterium sp.]|uniref:response regulator n=1 Tax=Methanobacterium sp. TaxID=2164 RepID=UPI003D654B10
MTVKRLLRIHMQAKILIVEDEAITAMDIKTTLEIFGYNVVSTAFSGEEAIEKSKKLKPNLVLMDINLKGDMEGIEAASQIMTIFNIPVIYLTAHSDENTFQRAKLTEPYGFIPKPVDYNGLKATIENALYKHSIELKLKESESRYRSIYENSFDAILLTRPDCSILAANPAAEKMFQMNEDEIIKVGQKGMMVDDDNLKHAITECEQKGIINTELSAKRKDGSIFPIELTGSVFKDVDGSFKTSVIIRDITKRKKAEDHFRKELERENFLLELYKIAPELSDKELY